MRILETLKIAMGGLRSNPLRSFLTVLGVVIGVTAVIMMVAIGEGAKHQVTSNIQRLGSNLLIVSPGRGGSRTTGLGAFGSGTQITLSVADFLKERCTLCSGVAPESSQNLAVRGPAASIQTSVVGVTPDYLSVRSHDLAVGEFVSDAHISEKQRVAVLGSSVATELYGEQDPIGQSVRIGNTRFRVIGVLATKGQSGWMNIDDQVLVPLTTAQRRLWRQTRLRAIYLQVIDADSMGPALEEVEDLLLERLKTPEAFSVSSQAEVLSAFESTAGTFTVLLAGIAGVSLLVGGIGIMNIMLVSVTERIREIGIRKALGATRQEILGQFLAEAITLSVLGGAIGIILGWLGSRGLARYAGWQPVVSPQSVLVAFGFSFMVGLFFGVYPASKASSLQPVEALRHD
jgi:putative ABC transport system permease protein